jgi:hypothetical protein
MDDAIVESLVDPSVDIIVVRDAPATMLVSWPELALVDHRCVWFCEDDVKAAVADFAWW